MARGIENKLKASLGNKLKRNFIKWFLAPYLLINSAFLPSVYALDTSWHLLNEKSWSETSRETKEKRKLDEKIDNIEIKYWVNGVYINNNQLKVYVKETKTGNLYYSFENIDNVAYERYNEYYRKNKSKVNKNKINNLIAGIISGALIGGIGGNIGDDNNKKQDYLKAGILLGFGLTLAMGSEMKKDRTSLTCDFKTEKETETSKEISLPYWEMQAEEYSLETNDAANVLINAVSDSFHASDIFYNEEGNMFTISHENGIAWMTIYPTEKNAAFSKKDLTAKIKEEYGAYVKPKAKAVLDEIIGKIKVKEGAVKIATKKLYDSEEDKAKFEIINTEEEHLINYYALSDEDIDSAIEYFVKGNIDKDIMETKFELRDAATRQDIANGTIKLKSNAPTKEEIASAYFSGPFLEKAVTYLSDYQTEGSVSSENNIIKFNAYLPATYSLQITHSSYKYIEIPRIKFEANNLEKIADMVRFGTKLTTEETKETNGHISDKK